MIPLRPEDQLHPRVVRSPLLKSGQVCYRSSVQITLSSNIAAQMRGRGEPAK